MTNHTPALLLTPRDAAKALAISPRSLWSFTKAGEIPHLRLGRSVRYRVVALADWLAAREKGGTA